MLRGLLRGVGTSLARTPLGKRRSINYLHSSTPVQGWFARDALRRSPRPGGVIVLLRACPTADDLHECVLYGEQLGRASTWLCKLYSVAFACVGKLGSGPDSDNAGKLLGALAARAKDMQDVFDGQTYTALVGACVGCGTFDLAERVFTNFRALAGTEPTTICYNSMIHGYSKSDQFEKASALIREMRSKDIPRTATTYSPLLEYLARRRRIPEAKEILERMRQDEIQYDVRLHNAILFMYSCGKETSKALGLLLEFLKEEEKGGMRVSREMFHSVMDGFANAGDKATVRKLYTQIGLRFKPDSYSFTLMIRSCLLHATIHGTWSEDVEAALSVWEDMKRARVAPAVIAYNSMIMLVGKTSVQDMLSFYESMIEKGQKPNVFTYCALAEGFRGIGEEERALEFMEKARNALGPGDDFRSYQLIRFQLETGNVALAVALLNSASAAHATNFNVVLNYLMRRSMYDKVDDVVSLMKLKRVPFNQSTYDILVRRAGLKSFPVKEVLLLYREMVARGIPRDPRTVDRCVFFCGSCPSDEARRLLDEIAEHDGETLRNCCRKSKAFSEAMLKQDVKKLEGSCETHN
ncbi:hypothetical protein NDN08_002373 [Rhodosorus marinus]|uniref:Pentacotripeptide-repeat region of PRORP domain-containing protein n=1 Tax=Rhodosorus marinus TaxID=101924 RepID=A0AAV8UTK5_9RHOD|nr:hypothetical protein NDN08_002373 [Rhodosorus marinus]